MQLFFLIVLGVLVVIEKISSAVFRRDISDANMLGNNPFLTDSDGSSHEDLSSWGLSNESGFATSLASSDVTEDNLSPPLSPESMAESTSSSCYPDINQPSSKIRARRSEVCSEGQVDRPQEEAISPTPELPNILDWSERAPLEFSIPTDLAIKHPMCLHKTFVTHVCCDGPLGEWRVEGYFASIEKCWPCE